MNGSPAKLGTIQGTSGHKAALEEASPNKFNAAILTTLAKTVGKVVKKGAKFVKGVVTKKGGGKTGIPKGSGKGSASFAAKGSGKTGTGVDTKPSTSTVPKDAEGNIKMSQQVRQEKRLAKVSERRRSKGKGKSTREVMLEKKVAMPPDE